MYLRLLLLWPFAIYSFHPRRRVKKGSMTMTTVIALDGHTRADFVIRDRSRWDYPGIHETGLLRILITLVICC